MAGRDEIEVVVTPLDVGCDEVRVSAAWLSDEERRRADRFARERDRDRFTVARARLRELLGARLGIAPASIELVYGERGKPALAPRHRATDLRFNLSHCEDVAVLAFAVGREIGVDVEAVRRLPDADDVAARVFSPSENAAYRALAPREKPLGFFNGWTRKEAFIKALGDGFHYPLDRFEVTLAPAEPVRLLNVEGTPGEKSGWTLHAFAPAPGWVGAIAVETPDGPDATLRSDRVVVRSRLRGNFTGTPNEYNDA